VIPNITRGGNMADLLRYLYGPGKANEHTRPHLVASSQHAATLDKPLGETLRTGDVKLRTDYLEQHRRLHGMVVKRWLNAKGEVVSKVNPNAQRKAAHVWHCSLSLPGPLLTGKQRAAIKRQYEVASLAELSDKQWRKTAKRYGVEPPERLTDEQFADVARRFTELMGFNGAEAFRETLAQHTELEKPLTQLKGWDARKARMNFGAIRWDAVNHGLNSEGLTHIHIAADIVAEDGNLWEDVYDAKRAQVAAGIMEREFGLRLVDGHRYDRGQQGYKKGELEHDHRQGRDVGDMVRGTHGVQYIDKSTAHPERGARRLLERTMRACAVAASDELDFVRRLRHESVDIKHAEYDRGRGRNLVTGYQVRLADNDSERWFGGGKVAKDLTLPALRAAGNWPRLDGDQVAQWTDVATRTLTPPDYATVIEAETALAELRQRLTEVDVTDTVAWAHVARDVSGMLNAISLRTEPEPGPLADAAYAIAATATINRTVGDRRRWLGRAASRSAASALMAQRPARSSRELMQQVSYMVNQITQMHLLAAQEQRAREVELRTYDTLQTWLQQHPADLAPANTGWTDHGPELGGELTR